MEKKWQFLGLIIGILLIQFQNVLSILFWIGLGLVVLFSKTLRLIEFPKFKINGSEYAIDKRKGQKLLGVGLTTVVLWAIYTKTGIEAIIENFFMSIPIISFIMQYDIFKVFVIAVVLYYIRDLLD